MTFELTKEEMEEFNWEFPKTDAKQKEFEEAREALKDCERRVNLLTHEVIQVMQEEGHWFMDVDHPMHKIHKDMFEFMQKKKEGLR